MAEPNDAIEQAIDRVDQAEPETPTDYRADLPVFPEPVVLAPDSVVTFNVPPGADGPMLLLLDFNEQRWRGFSLPPDTVWQLQRVELAPAGPKLWKPGDPVQ